MVGVVGAAVGALAIIAATMLEELTHAAAARPWAVSQRLEPRKMHVIHELPAERSERVDQWISLAPMAVGLAALALVVLANGVPPLSDDTVLLWIAWAWFTVPSLTDLKSATGNSPDEPQTTDDPRMHAAWMGGTIQSVGLLVLMANDELVALLAPTAPDLGISIVELSLYLRRLGIYLSLGGCLWIFIRLELIRRGIDTEATR